MNDKGLADNNINIETPNGVVVTKKPLKTDKISSGRVDINVLKSKLQETESKECCLAEHLCVIFSRVC